MEFEPVNKHEQPSDIPETDRRLVGGHAINFFKRDGGGSATVHRAEAEDPASLTDQLDMLQGD